MNIFSKSKKEDEVKKEKLSERDLLIIVASSIAFFFLSLFIFIEKLPFDWVYVLFLLFTSDHMKWVLVSMVPFVIYWSIKEKNIGYVLVLLSLMGGQYMFVHHFADNYSLPHEEIKADKKGRQMYFPNQNMG